MTGPVAPRLDPILKLAQIEPHYVGPDHAREMVFPDQAVDIHRAQLDLVAFGLAKARRARWCGFALWLCAFREPFKKLVASHRSPHANQPSQGITAGPASATLQLSFAKDSQPLRVTSGFGFSCAPSPGCRRLVCASCTTGRHFAYSFLQTPPRDDALAVRLTVPITRVRRGLSPPSHRPDTI